MQRLANDSDPYEWQQRGESPSQQSVLPMFGWNVAAGSNLERRRQHEDEQWAHQFETDHAERLHHLRNERYAELRREALREKPALIEVNERAFARGRELARAKEEVACS